MASRLKILRKNGGKLGNYLDLLGLASSLSFCDGKETIFRLTSQLNLFEES